MTNLVGIQNSILVLDSSNEFKIHESLKGTIHKEWHSILKIQAAHPVVRINPGL